MENTNMNALQKWALMQKQVELIQRATSKLNHNPNTLNIFPSGVIQNLNPSEIYSSPIPTINFPTQQASPLVQLLQQQLVANELRLNQLRNQRLLQAHESLNMIPTQTCFVARKPDNARAPLKEQLQETKEDVSLLKGQKSIKTSNKLQKSSKKNSKTIEKRHIDEHGLEAMMPKKKRRQASEIIRHFKCPFPGCSKAYGHEASLKIHFKNKHSWMTENLSFQYTSA